MDGKHTILITGISRGLGKALFECALTQGHHVFGVLRNTSKAGELNKDLPADGQIIITDLSTDGAIESIQLAVGNRPLDLLINNAGIGGESFTLDKVNSEEMSLLFNIHCLGVLRATKAVKDNLLKAQNPLVINLNSRFGSITRKSLGIYDNMDVTYAYSVAKAAQNMLTNCLRKEFRNHIRFISLHPGKMKTDIAQIDADSEPEVIARKILEQYESGKFKEENGILEMGQQLIEW